MGDVCNAQSILIIINFMYDDIGFWDKVKQEKIPDAKFIRIERRNENASLPQIVGATDMQNFISDRTTQFSLPENRVAIPLTDPEMNVTFYAVCRRDKADDWWALLQTFQNGLEMRKT